MKAAAVVNGGTRMERRMARHCARARHHAGFHKRSLFLMFTTSVLLLSCVAYRESGYYRPEASGGTPKSSACHGTSGPPDTIEFVRNDVAIRVKLFQVENGYSPFIQLQIPEGREVRLAGPGIVVSSPSNPAKTEGILKPLTYQGQIPWRIEENMKGKGGRFAMDARVTMPKSNVIKVLLPKIYIDGQSVQLPEISFTKDRYTEVLAPDC